MPSRFGLKDAIVIVLLLGVGVSVWLKMVQDDRAWRKLTAIEARLEELEKGIGEIKRGGQKPAGPVSGPTVPSPIPPSATTSPPALSAAAPSAAASPPRDESWAITGVPIKWFDTLRPVTDPRTQPGFKEGGEFGEILEGDPAIITPCRGKNAYSRRIIELVCEGLADTHPVTLQLRGRLAEAWQLDPAGKKLRVRIREGAVFRDGSPVTADDVVWTFEEVIQNPEIRGVLARAETSAVTSVKALSPKVVEFIFDSLAYSLEERVLTQPVMAKAFYSKFTPKQLSDSTGLLFGSGPFRLKTEGSGLAAQWKSGTPVELERNPAYWGPRPPLDRVRFFTAPDEKARLEILRRGEADMIMPTSSQAATLAADAAFVADHAVLKWIGVKQGVNAIVWNCGGNGRDTPFKDARVRRAMTMLLDRELILRDCYEGVGVVAAGPFNPKSAMANPELKPIAFDVAAAKALLEEAGWKDRDGDSVLEDLSGRKFEFAFTFIASVESDQKLAAYLRAQCAAAGIVCRSEGVAVSELQERAGTGAFEAIRYATSLSSPEPDPYRTWHSKSMPEAGQNVAFWKNGEADGLIASGREELDPVKRRAVWARLDGLIAQEQPWTFLRHAALLRVMRSRIGNVQQYPGGLEVAEFFRREEAPTNAKSSAK